MGERERETFIRATRGAMNGFHDEKRKWINKGSSRGTRTQKKLSLKLKLINIHKKSKMRGEEREEEVKKRKYTSYGGEVSCERR